MGFSWYKLPSNVVAFQPLIGIRESRSNATTKVKRVVTSEDQWGEAALRSFKPGVQEAILGWAGWAGGRPRVDLPTQLLPLKRMKWLLVLLRKWPGAFFSNIIQAILCCIRSIILCLTAVCHRLVLFGNLRFGFVAITCGVCCATFNKEGKVEDTILPSCNIWNVCLLNGVFTLAH